MTRSTGKILLSNYLVHLVPSQVSVDTLSILHSSPGHQLVSSPQVPLLAPVLSAWLPEFAKVSKNHKGIMTHLTFWFSLVSTPFSPPVPSAALRHSPSLVTDILQKWSYHQTIHLPWEISLLFSVLNSLCGQ